MHNSAPFVVVQRPGCGSAAFSSRETDCWAACGVVAGRRRQLARALRGARAAYGCPGCAADSYSRTHALGWFAPAADEIEAVAGSLNRQTAEYSGRVRAQAVCGRWGELSRALDGKRHAPLCSRADYLRYGRMPHTHLHVALTARIFWLYEHLLTRSDRSLWSRARRPILRAAAQRKAASSGLTSPRPRVTCKNVRVNAIIR
jgi:hypothetical protein